MATAFHRVVPSFRSRLTKSLMVLAIAFAGAFSAHAQLVPADSNSFANQYNGDQIFDGSTGINGWVAAGGIDDSNLLLDGSNLVVTLVDTNGWIQHDNDATPWEAGTGSWTVEVRANITADANGAGGFVIWGALNGGRDIMVVHEDRIEDLAGTQYDSSANASAFHDYRLSYDATSDTYHYFRDGSQITPAAGIAQQDASGNTRLIIGDCCTNSGSGTLGGAGTSVEYEYVRYDNTGAFSPIPEPSSAAIGIFGFMGLFAFTRRRR